MAVRHIPDGYHAVTPYLVVEGADKLIDFMKDVFGATERMRMPGPIGVVGHAEMEIGDSVVMLADSASADNNIVMTAMVDPFGNRWFVATHVEDVSPEEMLRRSEELLKPQGQA